MVVITTQAGLYDGAVHTLPDDLQQTLDRENLAGLWNGLTLLARNEFICWVSDAKRKKPAPAASDAPAKSSTKASAARAVGPDANTAREMANNNSLYTKLCGQRIFILHDDS